MLVALCAIPLRAGSLMCNRYPHLNHWFKVSSIRYGTFGGTFYSPDHALGQQYTPRPEA